MGRLLSRLYYGRRRRTLRRTWLIVRLLLRSTRRKSNPWRRLAKAGSSSRKVAVVQPPFPARLARPAPLSDRSIFGGNALGEQAAFGLHERGQADEGPGSLSARVARAAPVDAQHDVDTGARYVLELAVIPVGVIPGVAGGVPRVIGE